MDVFKFRDTTFYGSSTAAVPFTREERLNATAKARRLRLLLVQPQAENAGAQEVARVLARGLAGKGHLVKQAFFFRRTSSFEAEGAVTFCADERPSSAWGLARLLLRLRREIRAFRPDAVLCFQHFGNVIGAPVARLAGSAVVLANQNTDALSMSRRVRWLDRCLGRFGAYDEIIAVSASAEKGFRDYPESYRRRLRRIDHGVDLKSTRLTKGEARRRFGIPEESVLLGCAARLHPMKNLEAAIRLLPREPEWRLAFAGQGPDRERLARLAAELGCEDRMHWLGELDGSGVADFLRALDVFVFPSLSESFGLAAAEAAQAGVPVVANDLPVLREVLSVEGSPCARFAPATDVERLHAAVSEVVSDKNLAERMSRLGRCLAQRYPVEAMVTAYDELLQRLVCEG